jgi:phytoene synthase
MVPAGAFDHCRRLVAEIDKERYWATLYAPADRRDALYALYAFDHEIARVAAVVREPMAGEIRLQWWRDVFEGKRDGEAAAHPVAAALLDAISRWNLSAAQLIDVIDAHAADLDQDAPIDIETYGAATSGAIIALATRILRGDNADAQHIASHIGIARTYALAKQPEEARRHLDLARDLLPRIPAEILPAILPAATIGPSLDRKLPLWRRQWLIWRAARNPQRMFG